MIPRTYPSTVNASSGKTQMVVAYLTSITGLVRWTDYIPVKSHFGNALSEDTYDKYGYIPYAEIALTSSHKKWIDYVPVYYDNNATDSWVVSNGGFIPLMPTGSAEIMGILRSYTGSLYLPSPTSCFTDVAGTTPCTVDSSVALMLDEMRTLGSELVTNGDFSAGTTGWTTIQSGWTVGSGVASINSAVAGSTIIRQGTTVAGRMYAVTFTITSYTSGNMFPVVGNTLPPIGITSTGTFTRYLIATDTTGFGAYGSSTNTVASVDNISVREVTGIHATQATAGFRPVLRGKVKNYLLNSATLSTQNVTTAAVPYTLQFKGTGTVTLSGTSTAGPLVGTGASNLVTLTFTPTAGTLTLTVSGSVTVGQLELGTVANPYVATGATVASSSYGPYWLDFDGVDDRMQLSAVPFQMADDSFVVAGATQLSTAALQQLFFVGAAAGSGRVNAIYSGAGGNPAAIWRDDAALVVATPTAAAVTAGSSFVIAAKKLSSAVAARKNAGSFVTGSVAGVGVTTANNVSIGSLQGGSNFWNGPIYSIALGKGAITDSQLLTVERYVGQKTGVTI